MKGKVLTVAELIEVLRAMPPDAHVLADGTEANLLVTGVVLNGTTWLGTEGVARVAGPGDYVVLQGE